MARPAVPPVVNPDEITPTDVDSDQPPNDLTVAKMVPAKIGSSNFITKLPALD